MVIDEGVVDLTDAFDSVSTIKEVEKLVERIVKEDGEYFTKPQITSLYNVKEVSLSTQSTKAKLGMDKDTYGTTISQSETDVKYEQAVYEDAPVIGEINTSTFKNEKFEFDNGFDKRKDFKAFANSLAEQLLKPENGWNCGMWDETGCGCYYDSSTKQVLEHIRSVLENSGNLTLSSIGAKTGKLTRLIEDIQNGQRISEEHYEGLGVRHTDNSRLLVSNIGNMEEIGRARSGELVRLTLLLRSTMGSLQQIARQGFVESTNRGISNEVKGSDKDTSGSVSERTKSGESSSNRGLSEIIDRAEVLNQGSVDETVFLQSQPRQRKVVKGSFDAFKKSIGITKDADASTYSHEFSHFWIDSIWKHIESGNASEEYIKRFEGVMKYIGAERGKKLTREQHEKFARAYEKFLFTMVKNLFFGDNFA